MFKFTYMRAAHIIIIIIRDYEYGKVFTYQKVVQNILNYLCMWCVSVVNAITWNWCAVLFVGCAARNEDQNGFRCRSQISCSSLTIMPYALALNTMPYTTHQWKGVIKMSEMLVRSTDGKWSEHIRKHIETRWLTIATTICSMWVCSVCTQFVFMYSWRMHAWHIKVSRKSIHTTTTAKMLQAKWISDITKAPKNKQTEKKNHSHSCTLHMRYNYLCKVGPFAAVLLLIYRCGCALCTSFVHNFLFIRLISLNMFAVMLLYTFIKSTSY